jgi:hypothetical protein
MRNFSYITVGKILDELWEEKKTSGASEADLWKIKPDGKKVKKYPVTRVTFYRLEERLGLPKGQKTNGKLQWRVYSRDEADQVKQRIKGEYNLSHDYPVAQVIATT